MGKNTGIEWTDHTWNPWRGCLKVSPGCKACYMYRDQERYGNDPMAVVRAADKTFHSPMSWKEPAKVFTCSWSDFFIEQADEWREEAWAIIRNTPHLTYQILTKRPENIRDRLPSDWGGGYRNVWLGVSVENQDYVWRIEQLSYILSAIRFVSYEPALGPLHLAPYMEFGIVDWVISGGESGYERGKYEARPAQEWWFLDMLNQCRRFDVPFFHKQNGGTTRIDGAWGGRELMGETWEQFPEV